MIRSRIDPIPIPEDDRGGQRGWPTARNFHCSDDETALPPPLLFLVFFFFLLLPFSPSNNTVTTLAGSPDTRPGIDRLRVDSIPRFPSGREARAALDLVHRPPLLFFSSCFLLFLLFLLLLFRETLETSFFDDRSRYARSRSDSKYYIIYRASLRESFSSTSMFTRGKIENFLLSPRVGGGKRRKKKLFPPVSPIPYYPCVPVDSRHVKRTEGEREREREEGKERRQ